MGENFLKREGFLLARGGVWGEINGGEAGVVHAAKQGRGKGCVRKEGRAADVRTAVGEVWFLDRRLKTNKHM